MARTARIGRSSAHRIERPCDGGSRRLLRVASYNIHRCIGSDARHDPDRVVAVIEELDADIIGLQEVDCRYHVEHGVDQIDYLAAATGLFATSAPTMQRCGSTYGNAVLTRWQPSAVERVDLSVNSREPRGALGVELSIDDLTVRVIVTHFGLSPWERRLQTATLLRMIGEPGNVTVLCGDFNEWVPRWPTVHLLDDHLGRTTALRTFPARWPALSLDRIWVSPRSAACNLHAHHSRLARNASDHLPLVVAIDLDKVSIADQPQLVGRQEPAQHSG